MIVKGQRAAIFGLLLAGQSLSATANILGLATATVRAQITPDWVPMKRRGGKAVRPPQPRTGRKRTNPDEVIAYHDNGRRTLQEVGERFGITRERVRQILAKHGLTRRNQGTLAPEVLAGRLSLYLKALRPGRSTKDVLREVGLSYGEVKLAADVLGYQLPKTRTTRVDYREVADYYEANPHMTGRQVSAHFDISEQLLGKLLRKMGVRPRHKGWTHAARATAQQHPEAA